MASVEQAFAAWKVASEEEMHCVDAAYAIDTAEIRGQSADPAEKAAVYAAVDAAAARTKVAKDVYEDFLADR